MNWKTSFFKPKWQHKNAEIRARAVAQGHDPDLLAALESIATTDESTEVRLAAARRLDRPGAIVDALERETDAGVKEVLGARLRSLLTQPPAADSTLAERVAALHRTGSRDLWEAVAGNAPEPELRRAALEKIDRPGFLGDRAIGDPDPELRRMAAERIHQASTLKRVIEATRTKDKALHQALTRRLHEEQLAAGDKDAIDKEARIICEQLEAQVIRGDRHDADALAALEERWGALGNRAPGALKERFDTGLKRLHQPPPEPPTESPPEDEPVVQEPAPGLEPGKPADTDAVAAPRLREGFIQLESRLEKMHPPDTRKVERLAARWEALFASIGQPTDVDRKMDQSARSLLDQAGEKARQEEAKKEQLLATAREHLSQMQQALDNGELHKALELRALLQDAGAKLSGQRDWKPIQSKLSSVLGRLRELRDWQHWANDKIRKRLIAEMEALPGAGLHPDAVLDRIKALQSEWKSLEASEQIPGDRHYAAAPWMWRKFNAAGRAAFDLTKPYLDKRTEVQSKQLETFQSQAKELLENAGADKIDWKALNWSMNQVRKALRSLSSIPSKERKKTAALLKRALEAGKSVKQERFEQIEKQKLKLIREAAQLQHMDDHEEAMALAKSLQARWKDAGSLWRSRENELWQQFREPIDPLFAALDEERDRVRAEQAERRARQESLCKQLEELLGSEDTELKDQQGRVQGLSDEWGDFRQPDRRLRERFERALEKFNEKLAAQSRQEAALERERWWTKADVIHELETVVLSGQLTAAKRKKFEKEWPDTTPGASDIDRLLDQRFEAALESGQERTAIADADPKSAQKICIGLEFLAGLPGPEEEKELRMQYQVNRLSDSMTGERARVPALEEARTLEREWLVLAYVPDETHAGFRHRVHEALSKILEE